MTSVDKQLPHNFAQKWRSARKVCMISTIRHNLHELSRLNSLIATFPFHTNMFLCSRNGCYTTHKCHKYESRIHHRYENLACHETDSNHIKINWTCAYFAVELFFIENLITIQTVWKMTAGKTNLAVAALVVSSVLFAVVSLNCQHKSSIDPICSVIYLYEYWMNCTHKLPTMTFSRF